MHKLTEKERFDDIKNTLFNLDNFMAEPKIKSTNSLIKKFTFEKLDYTDSDVESIEPESPHSKILNE